MLGMSPESIEKLQQMLQDDDILDQIAGQFASQGNPDVAPPRDVVEMLTRIQNRIQKAEADQQVQQSGAMGSPVGQMLGGIASGPPQGTLPPAPSGPGPMGSGGGLGAMLGI